MDEAQSTNDPASLHAIALVACEVFRSEIAALAGGCSHIKDSCWLEIGLHDRPDEMRAALQDTVTALDGRDDIEAIVLAYGLCGRGTAGLRAGRHPLVIPRAHDCITVFLGSKDEYARRQRECPGCYHYTPGWNRARRVPGPERLESLREEYSKRFDPDDADFLLESERSMWISYDTASFIDQGTPDAQDEAAYSRKCAEFLGWKFEHLKGDPTLLRDLLFGPWDDERFQFVPPGGMLAHAPDERILKVEPATRS
jgi:hypothetical protein